MNVCILRRASIRHLYNNISYIICKNIIFSTRMCRGYVCLRQFTVIHGINRLSPPCVTRELCHYYIPNKLQHNGSSVNECVESSNISFNEYIIDCITNINKSLSVNDWRSFEEDLLKRDYRVKTKARWETIAMQTLHQRKHIGLESAKCLMEYIRNKGEKPNISTLTAFIAIVGMYDNNELLIFDVYDELLDLTDVFDHHSCKNLIIGLTSTSRWKESLKILEMSKLTKNVLSGNSCSLIVEAAFRHQDFDTGFFILDEMYASRVTVNGGVFVEYIKQCDGEMVKINRVLEYMRKSCYFPTLDTVSLMEKYLNSSKYFTTSHTFVTKKGICGSCGHQLQPCDLTLQEFTDLRDLFLRDSLITDNPYIKSSPPEVKKFLQFLRETGPFDVVIDGLNVVLSVLHIPKNKPRIQPIFDLVKLLTQSDRSKRVLVIGRKHMLKLPAVNRLQSTAQCFFTADNSQDDPFMLYATLSSGPAAMFVSRDEMGDHKHLLGHVLGDVFRKWQRSRQIVNGAYNRQGTLNLKYPKEYDTLVQGDTGGWHIPYTTDERLRSFEHPNNWLCVRQS